MSSKIKLLLVVVAATIVFPLSASVDARVRDPRPKGLSLHDAAYYLDIIHTLPPSFRPLGADDLGADAPEDSATAAYGSEESGAFVILHLTVGKGRTLRVVTEELFEHPEDFFDSEAMSAYLADQGIPTEQISVTPGTWSDAAVGDRAMTAVHGFEVEGERGYFEVLVMLVGHGKDTAVVEIDHIFTAVPTVDVVHVADAVATKIRSGPPSREQTIARAAFVALSDLPDGYHEVSSADAAADPSTDDGPAIGQIVAKTRQMPACEQLLWMLSSEAASGSGPSRSEGPEFGSGLARVSSSVAVYPTERSAHGAIQVFDDRATKTCVSRLYRQSLMAGLESGASTLAADQRKLVAGVEVNVATPRASALGDDRVLYVVTADLNPVRDVQLVFELEFVRVGRAVSLYMFSGDHGTTPREQVLPIVVDRLAAAQ